MEAPKVTMKRFDWHLFWSAAGVIVVVGGMIIGSYISLVNQISNSKLDLSKEVLQMRTELSHEISLLNAEVVKIQTVLIIKGIAPKEIFSMGKDD